MSFKSYQALLLNKQLPVHQGGSRRNKSQSSKPLVRRLQRESTGSNCVLSKKKGSKSTDGRAPATHCCSPVLQLVIRDIQSA